MEVTVEFTPGGWRLSPGWKVKHGDCEHHVTSIREYPQGFVEHMLDEHNKKVKPESLSIRYLVYGQDVTEQATRANEARATAEKADAEHKRIRTEVAQAMRACAPEDRPPFPYEFIGQLLNYEQSSVTTILRNPERRPKSVRATTTKTKGK